MTRFEKAYPTLSRSDFCRSLLRTSRHPGAVRVDDGLVHVEACRASPTGYHAVLISYDEATDMFDGHIPATQVDEIAAYDAAERLYEQVFPPPAS